VRTIPGNPHLQAGQEVHWIVSIRWRSQGGLYALTEWCDLSDRSIPTPRLYTGFAAGTVQTEALLRNLSPISITGDVRQESKLTFEVDPNRPLDSNGAKFFRDFFSAAYPPEYADVFVSCALGVDASRVSVLLWSGAIEAVEVSEDLVRLHCVDQSRKLMLPLAQRVDTATYPGADAGVVGQSKPIALGEVTDFTPQPVVQQFLTALENLLYETDVSMTVGSTKDFPDSGTVVVDDEEITYASKTDTTLDGLTRGTGGTVAAEHVSGTLVFAGTAQTVAGSTIHGPLFLLHGKALDAAAVVRAVRAYGGNGLQASEVSPADWVAELNRVAGAVLGLRKAWPQNPDQAADPAFYAVELDALAASNQTATGTKALGAHADFTETNFALVYNGFRLQVHRVADITQVGRQRIERAYVLVEYANLSNPSQGGLFVPNNGQSTSVFWYDAAGAAHNLGSLYPENEPLSEQINDPSRTVRTRAIEDQHRHNLSGGVGGGGPESTVVSISPAGFRSLALPTNGNVSPTGSGNYDIPSVTSIAADSSTNVRLGANFDTGTAPFRFRYDDEYALLVHAFRICTAFRFTYGSMNLGNLQLPTAKLEGGNGTVFAGTQAEVQPDEYAVSGSMSNLGFAMFWPPVLEAWATNDQIAAGQQYNDQITYVGDLRVTLAADAEVLPTTFLFSVPTNSTGSASNANGNAACNGLKPASDVSAPWTTGRVYYDAPNGTASIKRATLCWVGPAGANVRWTRSNGTVITNFSRGNLRDLVSLGLTVADLKDSYLEITGGVGAGLTWARLVLEYEGSLSNTDTETAQRYSSLKAFDVTEFITPDDWDSLLGTGSDRNSVRITSALSTGSFNSNERNNDSLWILRVSLLIQAAPPVTQLAGSVGVTYRGLIGANAAAAESRAAGDLLLALLTRPEYLNVGGTEYFPTDGWLKRSTFYSDQGGPTVLLNGVYRDVQDAVAVLADMADQARHLLYWEGGQLKMQPFRISGWGAAVQSFTDDHLLEPPTRPKRGAESILNKLLVEYDTDHVRRGFRSTITRENAGSQSLYGARRDAVLPMSANDKNTVDDPVAVQDQQATDLADSYLGRFALPAQPVIFDVPLVGLAVELGDVVALDSSAYTAAKVEVASMEIIPGFGKLDQVRITGLERA